jgi:hypothetical protein
MSLLNFQAELSETNFQLKRIADLLEAGLTPWVASDKDTEKRSATLYQVVPKSRWEAEKEDRQWRKVSDVEAAVMPRR